MAILKMVAGKTYACPAYFGQRILSKGDTVEVTPEQADMLLGETYMDLLNNIHPYFADVTPAKRTVSDSEEGAPKPVKTARARSAA